MKFTALLVVLLVGTACGQPVCPKNCTPSKHHEQLFRHVSDLSNTSVSPWSLIPDIQPDRLPEVIDHAVCQDCTVSDMIPKPIYFEISVYQRVTDNGSLWCRCPYELPVGCTCVKKQ